jgi:hypothetical protein
MAPDYHAGGHVFGSDPEKCKICGMPRTYYEDHDDPQCTGHFEPDEESEPRPRPG